MDTISAPPPTVVLLACVFVVWVLAGLADWWCHRRTGIESTSGIVEVGLHFVLLVEIGILLAAFVFFEINALVLAATGVVVVLHLLTSYADTSYAWRRRSIGPFEQHVHSVLDFAPAMVWMLIALLEHDALRVLWNGDGTVDDWRLSLRETPLPTAWIALVIGGAVLGNVIPFFEEFLRTVRHGSSHERDRG